MDLSGPRSIEQAFADLENMIRVQKEDHDGCRMRQTETHSQLGSIKDHVKMLDQVVDKQAKRVELQQRAIDALTTALEAGIRRLAEVEKITAAWGTRAPDPAAPS